MNQNTQPVKAADGKARRLLAFFGTAATLSLGIAIGVLFGFYIQTGDADQLSIALLWIGSLGLAGLIGYVVLHYLVRFMASSWSADKGARLIELLVSLATEPERRATSGPELAEHIRGALTLLAGAIASARALAISLLLLGTVIGLATLTAAHRQVERLDRQNTLLEAQNEQMVAQRVSSLFVVQLRDLLNRFRADEPADRSNFERAVGTLTRSLEPYRQVPVSSELELRVSPEKAQLLLSLIGAGFDLRFEEPPDFRHGDFSDLDLSSLDFGKADCANADFAGADLTGANLMHTSLRGSRLPEMPGAIMGPDHHVYSPRRSTSGGWRAGTDLMRAIVPVGWHERMRATNRTFDHWSWKEEALGDGGTLAVLSASPPPPVARFFDTDQIESRDPTRLVELINSLEPYVYPGSDGQPRNIEKGFAMAKAIVSHQQWAERVLSEGVDLSGADFLAWALSGVRWTGADLSGARFLGTTLANSDFSGVKSLSGASFSGLRRARRKCNLSGSDFTGVEIGDVTFEECNLSGVVFAGYAGGLDRFDGSNVLDAEFPDIELPWFELGVYSTNFTAAAEAFDAEHQWIRPDPPKVSDEDDETAPPWEPKFEFNPERYQLVRVDDYYILQQCTPEAEADFGDDIYLYLVRTASPESEGLYEFEESKRWGLVPGDFLKALCD